MKKLTYTHTITDKRDLGKTCVNQTMTIEVNYDAKEDSFEVENVFIRQGEVTLEVSKLLDNGEGQPLNAMLDAINWKDVYHESFQSNSLFNVFADIARTDAKERLGIEI